jgi:23S rRNA (guanosine2251-2'-O)-methyltransferase
MSSKKRKNPPQNYRKRQDRRSHPPLPIPGKRPVEELLERHIKPHILLTSKPIGTGREDSLIARCRQADWKIAQREKPDLDEAAEGLNHQGYVALIEDFPYLNLDQLISRSESEEGRLLIVLDQIQDAGNLGAILRSAECAGVEGAVIPERRSAGVTSTVIRRSAGAALHLPICRTVNLSQALDKLKEAGYRIFGADQEGAVSLYKADFSGPIALVIGSEARGLRPGIKRRCDAIIAIPLYGRISSLNASAAAAVFLFEIMRWKTSTP